MTEEKPLRLDLGCGKHKKDGFTGVDSRAFEGVDVVCNLASHTFIPTEAGFLYEQPRAVGPSVTTRGLFAFERWPWEDNSVDEIHCSHFVEHLDRYARIHFANESYRILKPGAKVTIITPNWSSCRAYGDLTHEWPPVSEFWYPYLNKAWREENAPHNDAYTCNFDCGHGYSLREDLTIKNPDYVAFALANYKEAGPDIIATLTKI